MMATKLLPDMEAREAHMLQAQRAAAQGQDMGTQIADLTVSSPLHRLPPFTSSL